MKLFLSSSSDALHLLSSRLPKGGKGVKVLFIENAADTDPGEHWWVKADRDELEKMGCEIEVVDLRTVSKSEFINTIQKSGLMHFCGGSTLYLISLIKEKGFLEIIRDHVEKGKIVYSGTSAGSMITADNMKLKLCKYDDEEKELADKITDYTGLSLVNFLIIPHCNNEHFTESNVKMIKHLPENPGALILLNDKQAVWVEDKKFEILEV